MSAALFAAAVATAGLAGAAAPPDPAAFPSVREWRGPSAPVTARWSRRRGTIQKARRELERRLGCRVPR